MKVGPCRVTSLLAVAIAIGTLRLLFSSLTLTTVPINNVDRLWKLPDATEEPSFVRGVKYVIILTYQRCGSSFLGSLFNHYPNAFYVFEPLDSLYSHLYGILPGWNVPSDIVTCPNGTERPVPHTERTAVARLLASLLHCNVSTLPTSTLVHHFFHVRRSEMTSTAEYAKCLVRRNVTTKSVSACYRHLRAVCPTRFIVDRRQSLERCHWLLHQRDSSVEHAERDPAVLRRVDKFTECLSEHRRRVDDGCTALLKSACQSRPLRAAKVVRATMQSMQMLFRLLPVGSKVIHLVRDPRAVALSRIQYNPSGRAEFTNVVKDRSERLMREASIYCRQVVADVRWRLRLEQQFPGRIYSLTYEQLVDDPSGQAADIFRFVGAEPTPVSAIERFSSLASAGSLNMSAMELTSRWRRNMTTEEWTSINDVCREMIELHPQYANSTVLVTEQQLNL